MYRLGKIVKALSWLVGCFLLLVLGLMLLAQEQGLMDWSLTQSVLAKVIDVKKGTGTESGSLVEVKDGSTTEVNVEMEEGEEIVTEIQIEDARAKLVANFIERNDIGNNSPLQPYDEYGRLFVEVADENGLDFRLLPAIARKESTFCKSNIATKYYNCFGYGVPASGITEAGKFTSYEEGIRKVASALKRNYIDKGLTDPIAIMQKYCPPSAEGEGTWATHLNEWMAEMRFDDKKVGREKAVNADLTEFVE